MAIPYAYRSIYGSGNQGSAPTAPNPQVRRPTGLVSALQGAQNAPAQAPPGGKGGGGGLPAAPPQVPTMEGQPGKGGGGGLPGGQAPVGPGMNAGWSGSGMRANWQEPLGQMGGLAGALGAMPPGAMQPQGGGKGGGGGLPGRSGSPPPPAAISTPPPRMRR